MEYVKSFRNWRSKDIQKSIHISNPIIMHEFISDLR